MLSSLKSTIPLVLTLLSQVAFSAREWCADTTETVASKSGNVRANLVPCLLPDEGNGTVLLYVDRPQYQQDGQWASPDGDYVLAATVKWMVDGERIDDGHGSSTGAFFIYTPHVPTKAFGTGIHHVSVNYTQDGPKYVGGDDRIRAQREFVIHVDE